ncbi:unnamed protein product [Peronospora destructor]|uniref:Uncharacterized protein n=1 Tax=Peronospora destructor TaxID=86335 RepID=A0AAV0VBY1_9STRA|nr:unnamed protein product [Peronospora destructor]
MLHTISNKAQVMMMDELITGGRVQAVVDSLHPVYGETHKCLLSPSANWYCLKIGDWGRSDVFGLLFAFEAKHNVFYLSVIEEHEVQAAAAAVFKSEGLVFCTTSAGKEGSVQIWDVASLTTIEQHRKQ